MNATEKKPYIKPVLKTYGKVKDLTATGSGDPRFCPNGKPKPPTGNCGPFG